MAGIMLCDATPQVTERGGLFVIETESGGERIALALTQAAICILAHRAKEAVNTLAEQRRANVVSLQRGKPERKRKRTPCSATAGGEG